MFSFILNNRGEVKLPAAEDLGVGEELSKEQRESIQEFKDQDWDAALEEKEDETPEEKEAREKAEEAAKHKEEAKEGDETPEEKEAREKEEAAAKKKEEDEGAAEAKEAERLEKKATKLEKTVDEVKALEAGEKAENDRIEAIAKEDGITAEEVKENEAKDKSLAERHGGDAVKVARALRKEQSEYGKLKKESDDLRDYKAQAEAQRTKFNEKAFNARMEEHRDDLIDKYREKFPNDSLDSKGEELSDDAIFERGKALVKEGIKDKEQKNAKDVEKTAKEKRAELIKDLPEEFKDHLTEVKDLLDTTDDLQILDKEFDVVFIGNYARGKKFTPDHVKSLEDAAYKRGVEQAKILPKGSKTPKPTEKTKGGSAATKNMTAEQKSRAEEIYGRHDGWSKEQMWAEYMKDGKPEDDF